jgi:hypothetical protein
MRDGGYIRDTARDARVGRMITKTPDLLRSDDWKHVKDLLSQFHNKQQIMLMLPVKLTSPPMEAEDENRGRRLKRKERFIRSRSIEDLQDANDESEEPEERFYESREEYVEDSVG